MNNIEISAILDSIPSLKKYPKYVCASDELNLINLPPTPICIIFNSNTTFQNNNVGHWMALYLSKRENIAELFDTFGRGVDGNCHVKDFLTKHFSHYTHNTKIVQSNNSLSCGAFCIFLLHRRVNHSFLAIINMFHNEPEKNDHMINSYICKTFNFCRLKTQLNPMK